MMFDHLDDPEGFVPDDRLRTGVVAAARRRRRRRRLAGTGAGLSLVLVAAAVGVAALVRDDLDRIDRVQVTGLAEEPASGEPYVVLLVGIDAREGSSTPDGGPEAGGSRTDTILLALVDPPARRVSVLPIPRDLWVDVPGHGPARVNQAYARGGRSLLVETLRQAFGIEVVHYLEVGFDGVRRIGDQLGGLRLAFDRPVRDRATGLEAEPGCRAYDGTGLLALARARSLEERTGTGWERDPTADLGRIERQQAIGLALFDALGRLDRSDPRDLARLLDAVAPHLTLDGETSDGDLLALSRGILGSEVRSLRLPVRQADAVGAIVLVPGPGADGVLAEVRGPEGGEAHGPPAGVDLPDPGGPAPSGAGAVVPRPC